MTKEDLRHKMKFIERTLPEQYVHSHSERIIANLQELPSFKDARTVLLYSSIRGEVETGTFIEEISKNKSIVLPAMVNDEIELRLYSAGNFSKGDYGIYEPDSSSQVIDPSNIDLAVVPGIAFALRNGKYDRLGRGKGCYDRLIPKLNCEAIGICFPFRMVDEIPCDNNDVQVDGCLF